MRSLRRWFPGVAAIVVVSAIWVARLPVAAAGGAGVKSKAVYPAVIPADGSSGAMVQVRTDAPASSVVIDLASGGSVPFVAIDAQTFSAVLTPEQLLFDYTADDVNRNFVGYLKVTPASSGDVSSFNFFVNVDDATIADVPILQSASDIRCAPHVANLEVPSDDPAGLWEPLYDDVPSVLKRFYEVFSDDYDFANVVFLHPDLQTNRDHFPVRNDVQGIGVPIFNDTAVYGSAGTLLGVTRFPYDTVFDLVEPGALHEMGHQWINFLKTVPLLGGGSPHWPPSELAHGLMGVNIGNSSVGGSFPFKFVPLGGNSYTLVADPPSGVFTPLDLYLMGFIGPREVPNFVILDPVTQPLIGGTTVTGTTMGISQVIDVVGARVPNAASSPKHFRMATVLVTRTGALTDRELAFFDAFAARGEATAPLPYSSGLLKGTAYPFPIATNGLGGLDTSMACPVPKKTFDDVAVCRFCPPDPCIACNGLLRAIDLVVFPEVSVPGIRMSLDAKIVSADRAYKRGQTQVAATHLDAFLQEIAAQRGHALTDQAAGAIASLTIRAAQVLEIPLEGIESPR